MTVSGRGSRTTSPSHGQVWIAAAAAAIVLVATASEAFVTAAPPLHSVQLGQSAIASRSTSVNMRTSTNGQADLLFRASAATALLCLAFASRTSTPKPRASVQCRAVLVPASYAPAATVPAPVAPVQLEQAPLIDFEATEEVIVAPAMDIVMESKPTEAPATPDVITATPSVAAPRVRAGRARLAGGSRRASRPRAARSARRAAASASKARSSIGKRLQKRVAPSPVGAPAFDPSTVRQSVQIGLRISSTLRSEKGRECKSTSALEGSDMSTGLRIQANAYGE
mmetsp:Transcript_47466/g.110947  ORF Transcript_47466/g.110947 Transcript_47466/m.110947 type:complete len:283 (+) Transcript_47466:73-921(+)